MERLKMPGSNIFPEKIERLVCDFLNQKTKWKIETREGYQMRNTEMRTRISPGGGRSTRDMRGRK
jgi:phenylacetate-coenzyme A ligase PaaK-like adenylate-forming protein